MWLPWTWAVAIAAALIIAAWWAGSIARPSLRAVFVEAAVVMLLYALWIRAGALDPFGRDGGMARGLQVWHLQRWLHLPPEYWLQRGPLANRWLIQASNLYYGGVHVPAMGAFLVWLFFRHRQAYGRWRTTLAITTAACLVVRYVPVAPPRFFPEEGFVDTALLYGQSVYGPPGTGVSGQMAAMPSIHVAWAVLIGVAGWRLARTRWRWVGPAHAFATVWVVTNTANHWWLDGVVGCVFLGAAWWLAGRLADRRPARAPAAVGVEATAGRR